MENCELCNLEKKSKWYHEDDHFIICDCITCKCPMIVLKRHDTELSLIERDEIPKLIILFGIDKGRKPDWNRSKIKDHWHCHLRA